MSVFRSKVLSCYRMLHRTRKVVFAGDPRALEEAKLHFRNEFRKNMNESNPGKIKRLLHIAKDVDLLLNKTVAQAVVNERGNLEIRLREGLLSGAADGVEQKPLTCSPGSGS